MPETTSPAPSLGGLLNLAWPIIIARSAQTVVGLADSLMVAHLGQAALASTTAGAMNSFAFMIFPFGVVFIVSSFSSQLTGSGDAAGARRYGWYGLAVALVAQLLSLAFLPALPWLLGHFDYEPAVLSGMVTYISIRLLSVWAATGIEALGNYYSGTGNTGLQMRFNLAAMVMNVALNWLLIDGRWGCPAMGVAGAAWASVISTSLAFLGFVWIFLANGRGIPKAGSRWSGREFFRMLKFGLPSGLNWSFEFFAFLAYINVVVGGLGTTVLAAFMAVFQVNSVGFMPVFAISSAGAILVGQAIGRGAKAEVPKLLKLTFLTAASWMGILSLLYILLPEPLMLHFAPKGEHSQAFLEIGAKVLMLSACWQVLDAAGITIGEALRAAGDTAYAMWTRAVLAWLVFLPGSWITAAKFDGKIISASIWLIAYLGLLAIALWLRFRSGAWRKIELVQPH